MVVGGGGGIAGYSPETDNFKLKLKLFKSDIVLQEKQAVADQKKAEFHQAEGDHITLLAVYSVIIFFQIQSFDIQILLKMEIHHAIR